MSQSLDHQLAQHMLAAAEAHISARLNDDDGKAAAAIVQAMISAAMASDKPHVFLQASPQSIAACVMASMATGLYPGGHHPLVYLVPKAGQIQWRITARGISALLQRAGYRMTYTHVSSGDPMVFDLGQVVSHTPANRRSLPTFDTLDGIIVNLYRLDTGARIAADWVPFSVIEDRRKNSDMANKGPWARWPMEMACKTAALYLSARGSLPQIRELEEVAKHEVDIIDAESEPVPTPRRVATIAAPPIAALPGPTTQRQLAGPPIEAEWAPPPADLVPATQPAAQTQAQTTRSTPAAPPWLATNRERIANLAAAMGRPAATVGQARALLTDVGITPDTMEPADLATAIAAAIAEAAVNAAEREPNPAR